MNSNQFGQLAIQLLVNSNIPGGALEAALKFKEIAEALESGALVIREPVTEED